MVRGAARKFLPHLALRVPGLRRLPVFKLLAAAEIAILAHQHATRLEPAERGRLFALVRKGRGRRTNLTAEERDDLQRLVSKMEPRLFAGLAADRLSPLPLPRRVVHGKRSR